MLIFLDYFAQVGLRKTWIKISLNLACVCWEGILSFKTLKKSICYENKTSNLRCFVFQQFIGKSTKGILCSISKSLIILFLKCLLVNLLTTFQKGIGKYMTKKIYFNYKQTVNSKSHQSLTNKKLNLNTSDKNIALQIGNTT